MIAFILYVACMICIDKVQTIIHMIKTQGNLILLQTLSGKSVLNQVKECRCGLFYYINII